MNNVSISPADLDDFEAYIALQTHGREGPECADLEAYLRAFPGRSVRDWKGKGLPSPRDAKVWEKPWQKLDPREVRDAAVRSIARDLPRNIRQGAAHHPDLVWNQFARKYRLRVPSDPAPMGGGTETSCMVGDGPALVTPMNAMTKFCEELPHD